MAAKIFAFFLFSYFKYDPAFMQISLLKRFFYFNALSLKYVE